MCHKKTEKQRSVASLCWKKGKATLGPTLIRGLDVLDTMFEPFLVAILLSAAKQKQQFINNVQNKGGNQGTS